MPDHYLSRMFGLSGKRAVVTGATSGLGAAMASALAGAGAEVVVGGRDAARAPAVLRLRQRHEARGQAEHRQHPLERTARADLGGEQRLDRAILAEAP